MTESGGEHRPKITVLTPVYNEEACLPRFEQAVVADLFSRTDYDFRVLFVDDGSRDRSWSLIRELSARDPRFQGIRLSRNFGSHIALAAGFFNADGDAMATLPCDLQDPPRVVLEFLGKWRAGAQIVWGRRRTRDDERWRVWASHLFYRLVRRFAMPSQSQFATGSFLLADRRVVECYREYRERNRITFALVAWTGFEQAVVDYDRAARVAGQSGWSVSRMMKSMYDTFIGFSFLPIRLMTFAGLSAFALTAVMLAYLLSCWSTGNPAPGWTSIMFTVSFFSGIQFLLMGITGEYLYRIYIEVVRRPLYFTSDETKCVRGFDARDG